MQAVIAIPDRATLHQYGGVEQALMREVCGVPLLVRSIKTAILAGADSVVVIWPSNVPLTTWLECQRSLKKVSANRFTLSWPGNFNPRRNSDWVALSPVLKDSFLWLPWNWTTHKSALLELSSGPALPACWSMPAALEKHSVLHGGKIRPSSERQPEGVKVTSRETAWQAARLLVARAGKPLDGICSIFNRWLCRPAVRLLSYTPVAPDAVTWAGLAIALLGAWMFAQASYAAYVAGALLFFLSGLCDEMHGMLARIKFREPAFGTRFEGFVDNATCLLTFGGITAGLCKQHGVSELIYGIALMLGCVLSFLVGNSQRQRSTYPARPNEYLGKMYGLWDCDSSRYVHVFLKKAVVMHYLLWVTVLGGLPAFLRLAALGSNLTWILGVYSSRRFSRRPAWTGQLNVLVPPAK